MAEQTKAEIANALSNLGKATSVEEEEVQEDESSEDQLKRERKRADKANTKYDYTDVINGHIRQTVKISPNITIVFQTLNVLEAEYVQSAVETMKGRPVDYVASWQKALELALGIFEMNIFGTKLFLDTVKIDAKTDIPIPEEADKRRRKLLKLIPTTHMYKILNHFYWFLERVASDKLAEEQLGNG